MKNKNNVFLMLLAIATLLTAVVGATYAYFASVTDGTGVSTDLDVEAQANTAQFTAEGGTFGFTVTGADMMQANAGSLAKESTGSLEVNLTSPKLALCTFDVKFGWNEGSSYTPTATLADGVTEFGVLYEGNSYGAVNNAAKVINFDKLLNNYDGIVLDQAKIAILESDGTEKTKTINLNFKVQMYNLNHDQSALAGGSSKSYSGKFYIDNVECTETKLPLNDVILASNEIYPDNIASPYVTNETGIDFAQISSDTNGKGLYYTNDNTENNDYTFYFRGDVENNYVKMPTYNTTVQQDYCEYNGQPVIYNVWDDVLVMATQEACTNGYITVLNNPIALRNDWEGDYYPSVPDGYTTTIYMIVDEVSSGGYCQYYSQGNCKETLSVTGQWKSHTSTVEQGGTVWRIVRVNEDGSIRLIEETSTEFSTSPYSAYLSDIGFCDDMSIYKTQNGVTYYGAYERIIENNAPQFGCPESDDIVQSLVGQLTADELSYAGAAYYPSYNRSYYLKNVEGFPTITKSLYISEDYDFDSNVELANSYCGTNAYEYFVNGSYSISRYGQCELNDGLIERRVINLNSNVKFSSGNGSSSSPYTIITE